MSVASLALRLAALERLPGGDGPCPRHDVSIGIRSVEDGVTTSELPPSHHPCRWCGRPRRSSGSRSRPSRIGPTNERRLICYAPGGPEPRDAPVLGRIGVDPAGEPLRGCEERSERAAPTRGMVDIFTIVVCTQAAAQEPARSGCRFHELLAAPRQQAMPPSGELDTPVDALDEASRLQPRDRPGHRRPLRSL